MENPFKNLMRAGVVSFATLAISSQELPAQTTSTLRNEKCSINVNALEYRHDGNLSAGFDREIVMLKENGKERPVASLFYFDKTTKADFFTKDKNPNLFTPEIDYSKINAETQKNGVETIIAFAGAYESTTAGKIEGITVQDGVQINTEISKSGCVYITPSGSIEMYRFAKDPQTGAYDKNAFDQLTSRAKNEHGSLFQQLPAIWDGVERLNSTNQAKFEFRAICATKDGKQFVLNCTEKITLRDFLIFALNLKDANGNPLVDDLMLTDTGVYSYGMFRDKNQVASGTGSYSMIDENFPNKKGYTNVVTIGTVSTKQVINPNPQQKQQQPIPQPVKKTNPQDVTPPFGQPNQQPQQKGYPIGNPANPGGDPIDYQRF